MAGSISLSLTQQLDELGVPLNGGLLYFYAAGTSTPQSAYQDSALTIPWPNPIELSSDGRIPQLFLADGSIKIRLTDALGVTKLAADGILVVGASSGGGGGSTVDATTVLTTGDVKLRYGTGVLSGFVRANGRTLGSATSGATERANADTQSLFEYLWGADTNLSVSTGRGASAHADWLANKAINLPDCRGRPIAGLGDMGNGDAGRLTLANFGADPTVLGNAGGSETSQLTTAGQLPNVNFTGNTAAITIPTNYDAFNINGLAGGSVAAIAHGSTSPTSAVSVNSGGSSTAFKTVSPMILATIYIKL